LALVLPTASNDHFRYPWFHFRYPFEPLRFPPVSLGATLTGRRRSALTPLPRPSPAIP